MTTVKDDDEGTTTGMTRVTIETTRVTTGMTRVTTKATIGVTMGTMTKATTGKPAVRRPQEGTLDLLPDLTLDQTRQAVPSLA